MRLSRSWQLVAAAGVSVAAIAAACGGDSDGRVTVQTPQATEGASSTAGAATAAPTEASSATPSLTPPATATAKPTEAPEAIIAAALRLTGARYLSPLTRDGCLQGNPEMRPCIELVTPAGDLGLGLARFGGGDPAGGPFTLLLGRDAAGAWGLWYETRQPTYSLLALPGDVTACPSNGPLTVRAEARGDAATATTVERGEKLRADSFLLARPGVRAGNRGEGWYHVDAPRAGWVVASEVADRALGGCQLRDAIEGVSHG